MPAHAKRSPRTTRFGAGALILHDGHVLLARRSASEHEPLTWSVFGGMAEAGEDPWSCAVRETLEEAGIDLRRCKASVADVFTNPASGFRYITFAVSLDRHRDPRISEETQEADWFKLGSGPDDLWKRIPSPLHSGLRRLVSLPEPAAVVLRHAGRP